MPLSALPEHLNTKEEIDAAFPDDSQYGTNWFGRLYQRYNKITKTWFAFSYRCTERWAKWRLYPKVLFAVGGGGPWRWECVHRAQPDIHDYNTNPKTGGQPAFYYLSRIQYYKRWHFAIQWPLIFTFHFYPKAKDVPLPSYRNRDHSNLDGKLWFGYWNHFDADLIYWMVTSVYLGRNFK